MMRGLLVLIVGGLCLLVGGDTQAQVEPGTSWQTRLSRRSLAFGHRNWIVVADAAYPAQTSPGIETVVTQEDHLDVLRHVLEVLSDRKHIRPVVYLDEELAQVPEADAPGVDKLRASIREQLADFKPQALPHEEIIALLDKAGAKFQVLVLKTSARVPYTSVFLELDCGYWSPDAEKRLREAMKKAPKP
jgi:hypothetical protein